MEYVLRKLGSMPSPDVPITEDEYRELKTARKALSWALRIEELYETVILSLLDLEKETASIASTYIVRSHPSDMYLFESKIRFNFRMITLLSFARMYFEQTPQLLEKIDSEKSKVVSDFDRIRKAQHSSEVYYQFMEELRNYAQHNELPSHSTTIGSQLTDSKNPESQIEVYVHFYAHCEQLLEDKKFRKTVLEKFEEKIDLRLASRTYVECLSRIHTATRGLIYPIISNCCHLIEQAKKRYEEASGQPNSLVCACPMHCETDADEIHLVMRSDDFRQQLIIRNQLLRNLGKTYVSGATTKRE